MTTTDLLTLLVQHAPPWLLHALSVLVALWALATTVANGLRALVPAARYAAFEARHPRLGYVARALRRLGSDAAPAVQALAQALGPRPLAPVNPPPAPPAPPAPLERAGDDRVTPVDPGGPSGHGGFARTAALVLLAVAAALAIVLPLAASLSACSGTQRPRPWQDTAQSALVVTAHGVAGADAVIAARYAQQSADAGSLDALEHRYAPAVAAYHATRETLLGAQAAVDAARRIDDAPARCRAALVLDATGDALGHLAVALVAAGLPEPPDLSTGLDLVIDLARTLAPSCGDAPDAHR